MCLCGTKFVCAAQNVSVRHKIKIIYACVVYEPSSKIHMAVGNNFKVIILQFGDVMGRPRARTLAESNNSTYSNVAYEKMRHRLSDFDGQPTREPYSELHSNTLVS